MKTYKVGIVGLRHGLYHTRTVTRCLKQAELTMLCDLFEDRLEEASKETCCKNTTTRYADMLADKDIDIICINTSDLNHGQFTLAALEAGKHVMVEVPLECHDMDTLWKIVRLCERRNLKIQLDLADPWLPESVTMKQIIDKGSIGEPYYVISEYIQDIRQQGGGQLLDIRNFRMGRGESPQEAVTGGAGTYAVATAMWYCGEPFTEVFCYGNSKNIPTRNVDDHEVALFKTRSGTIARVQCTKAARRPYKEIIKSVWGTKGTVECTGYLPAPAEDNTTVYACLTEAGSGAEIYDGKYEMKPVPLTRVAPPEGISEEMIKNAGHEGVEIHSWLDLIGSIENDRLSMYNVYEAFRVSASQYAARKSKEENRPVSIPQIIERHDELKALGALPIQNVSINDLW